MADYTTTAANIEFSFHAILDSNRRAGAAIAVGDIVRLDDSNRWIPAQANSLQNAGKQGQIGIVAASASAEGQPCIVCTKDPQLVIGFVLTLGEAVVMSAAAAGKMAPASDISTGEAAVLLGWPISRHGTATNEGNKINFDPIVSTIVHP